MIFPGVDKRRRSASGFTLIEVLVGMAVFVTALVVLLGIYTGIAALRESGRNTTQAVADARAVLEAMRDRSSTGLSNVTAQDWTQWAEDNGLTSLDSEVITVDYVDTSADPLEITVQVDWVERVRERSMTISTLMTQR